MRVAGVDGCPGGWVVVVREEGRVVHTGRITHLTALTDRPDAPAVIAIDMPIGLPARTGAKGRAPERLVRPLLGMRQSSVFSIPARAAVEAGVMQDGVAEGMDEAARYRAACALARATSDTGKAVAKQGFHIFPKIMEIDALLRARPDLVPRVFESHPELCFWAMNGCRAVPLAKKVKGRPHEEGLAFRRKLLIEQGFPDDAISAERARALKVGPDDLVDAAATAWAAGRIARGEAESYPSPPERDAYGLPIAIWV
ncbi:DUF429 domain-containing protein [Ancylobacter sp. 6x-1]|uniref:DUF429 domain-containing protein n=1 Tax=Ancylobacter crimeensis TaxID=2579147 RepID=A0ABT0DDJ2_9HYPH|nr:DUF429 domain-containing protein [Ancylobacter crimeensis]MCK0198038.1 DUF429 domain-containing protein [Ancylobacter crimeensis]